MPRRPEPRIDAGAGLSTSADDENRTLRHDLNLYDFPSPWRDRPPWLVVLGVRQIPGLAATDWLLFGCEEAGDDFRQQRVDGDGVVGGVGHDCELVGGPQRAIDPGI